MRKKTVQPPRTAGRPPVLADGDIVFIDGQGARTILQTESERRAVVNRLVQLGGRAAVSELNATFGYDTRHVLAALKREGWVGSASAKAAALPRRAKRQRLS